MKPTRKSWRVAKSSTFEIAFKDGHTTVLRGYLSVSQTAQHELHVDGGDAAFNVTTVDGREDWFHGIADSQSPAHKAAY